MNVAYGLVIALGVLVLPACVADRGPVRMPPGSDEPVRIVTEFFSIVRSGRAPERAGEFMAPIVLAHQMNAEEEVTVSRTPAEYAAHVREMLATYGDFRLETTERIADGDRVYVRWRQTGEHRAPIDGWAPTGRPLTEIASAVYRVQGGKIVEYWIQIDRQGLRRQLERRESP
jgi:predicted ester cyclase